MRKEKKEALVRYDYIDALRGIAIIGVVLAHTSLIETVAYPSWLTNITSIYVGPRGVQLFFVVSAFTLYLSWSKRKNREKYVIQNFYIRRFFRIAPLFYIALLYFLFIQNFWNGNPYKFTSMNIITTAGFANGIFPPWINNIVYGGWSIAVEMCFYFFFPLIVSWVRSIRIAVVATVVAMIVMQILRLYLNNSYLAFFNTYSTFTFQFFPSQLPVFLIGITVFLMMKTTWTQIDKKAVTISCGVCIVLLAFQLLLKLPIFAGHYLYGLVFGGLLYFLSVRSMWLFVNRVTTHIGKVSYSMYLCHVAVLYILANYHLVDFAPHYPILNFLLRFVLLLTVSTVISTVLFYVIERPGQILGKKIIDSYEKTPTNEITTALKTW